MLRYAQPRLASDERILISQRGYLPTGPGFLWQARDAVTYRDETVRRIREAMRISGSGPGPAEAGDGGGSH
ncbi:hypothetical protein AB0C47_25435 [Micromonospora taraxaci]|uniref:hypothetical protein n=1 Tax=Micromonospora taraxaci TaxID=1316803 RepID=UPI0033D78FDC